MDKFMLLFRFNPEVFQQAPPSPEDMQADLQRWLDWMGTLTQQGKMAGGEQLQMGGRVVSGTAKAVTEGPFAESKEIVSGYLLILAADLDEATEIGKGCPVLLSGGSVEIRPV
ncbi:MAG: YciI family protein [Bacteroidia bacterium]|nr:YciI family protein [Bacteroidia bacterium]